MFRPLTLFLAWRLLTGPRRRCLLGLCLVGASLGCAGQIAVGGVMNGMISQIQHGSEQYTPHLLVYSRTLEPEHVRPIAGVRACSRGTAGYALVNGQICSYVAGLPIAAFSHDETVNEGRDRTACWLSDTCAERLRHPETLQLIFAGDPAPVRRAAAGIFRVPGRMITPDLISMATLPGIPVLGIRLQTLDGGIPAVIRSIQALDAEARVVDGCESSHTWIDLLAKLRRSLSFLFGIGVCASSFCISVLLLVSSLRNRGSLAVCLAMGATPATLVAIYAWQAALLMLLSIPSGLLLGHLVLRFRIPLANFFEACGLGMYDAGVLNIPLPAQESLSLYGNAAVVSAIALILSVLPAAWAVLRSATPRSLSASSCS